MNTLTKKQYYKAKIEGRVCSNCRWIITKKDWKAGLRMCAGCTDAMRGVDVKYGAYPDCDEPKEKTGEM
jgi:hypothetical protein